MKYNFLKSRTFWTMVVIFLVNGYAAISHSVPAGADVIVNILLTAVATYFHIQTGNSTTGTN